LKVELGTIQKFTPTNQQKLSLHCTATILGLLCEKTSQISVKIQLTHTHISSESSDQIIVINNVPIYTILITETKLTAQKILKKVQKHHCHPFQVHRQTCTPLCFLSIKKSERVETIMI
jgi:hypothetical protein